MIKINSKELSDYVRFALGKLDESDFTQEELDSIEELVIGLNGFNGQRDIVTLKELSYFHNLKSIEIINLVVNNNEISSYLNTPSLKEIVFDRCMFEDESKIATLNINSLSLINCQINDYSFIYKMNYLRELSINNGIVCIEKLNNLKALKYLSISYSDVVDPDSILDLGKLKSLIVDNSNINLNKINNLKNLNELSISLDQFENNKNLIEELIASNVNVLNESISIFDVGEYNE